MFWICTNQCSKLKTQNSKHFLGPVVKPGITRPWHGRGYGFKRVSGFLFRVSSNFLSGNWQLDTGHSELPVRSNFFTLCSVSGVEFPVFSFGSGQKVLRIATNIICPLRYLVASLDRWMQNWRKGKMNRSKIEFISPYQSIYEMC